MLVKIDEIGRRHLLYQSFWSFRRESPRHKLTYSRNLEVQICPPDTTCVRKPSRPMTRGLEVRCRWHRWDRGTKLARIEYQQLTWWDRKDWQQYHFDDRSTISVSTFLRLSITDTYHEDSCCRITSKDKAVDEKASLGEDCRKSVLWNIVRRR